MGFNFTVILYKVCQGYFYRKGEKFLWKKKSIEKRYSQGFTLVELVVVIAIIAILAGVGGAAYSGYITRAKEAADYITLDAVKTAVLAACAESGKTVTKIEVIFDAKETEKFVKAYETAEGKYVEISGTNFDDTLFNTLYANNTKSSSAGKSSAEWTSANNEWEIK